jgi:transposase
MLEFCFARGNPSLHRLLGTLFPELQIARGTSVRSMLRTSKRCAPAYEQLRIDLRGASEVAPDETGWRVGGRPAWLRAFVSQRATCYVTTYDDGRSGPSGRAQAIAARILVWQVFGN